MSNIIPPLLSNTPPPPPSPEDDDDDEFGDFTGVNDLSYGCDNLSLPPSPDHSPKKVSNSHGLDINSNSEKNKIVQVDLGIDKDFQDKRKNSESFNELCNVEEKYIESVEENILQYAKNTVTDTPNMHDNVLENGSDADSKNYCNFSSLNDNITEQQQDVDSEIKSISNQQTLDNRITDDNKETENLFSTEIKEKPLSFTVDSNVKEEICSLSNNEEDKMNLENVGVFDNITVDTPLCELSSEENSSQKITSEITKSLELNDAICTQKSFIEQNSSNLTENREEKTSHESFTVWNTFEDDSIKNDENVNIKQICTDDEFADFAFADTEYKNSTETTYYSKTEDISSNYSDETFCKQKLQNENFTIPTKTTSEDIVQKIVNPVDEDDFDDFCEFTSNTFEQDSKQDKLQLSPEQSDFGNFANFAEVVEEPVFLLLNEKQALEKADSILKEIFPLSNTVEEDYQYADVESNDFIFNELKDITETNALTYLWSKSASQNMLLKALNIDARNILYGASWNPSMPRFAANLGLTPLEPIKTEISPCTLKSSPSTSSQPSSSDIPSAQFDWNGSGLVNPLDSVPKESAEMAQTSGERKSFELSGEQSILQPQIMDKPVTSQKVPSKNDLEQVSEENVDDFEDFTSYQSPTGSETWQNVVPLRETYISNDAKELPLDITNWLQPTIVTPELPRKDLEIGDEELPNIQTPEFIRKEVVALEENDDDFDDFQMVLPESTAIQKNNIEVKNSSFLQPDIKEPIVSSSSNMASTDFKNFAFPEEKTKVESMTNSVTDVDQNKTSLEINTVKHKEPAVVDDDDFTEFHCSVPAPQPTVPKPLTPILEPLKPVPVYTTIPTTSTQINWPDPGITDEEIKKFEMVFKRPQEYSGIESKKEIPDKNNEQTNKASKHSSFDDDEWSDFVSVQKPSPVHKFHSSEKERTSSPDLPLSVLNLNTIQPTKQPIPVITPQGLIQTKLSSSNSLNLSPKVQLKNNSINSQQKALYPKPQIHPSIISNQFASQVYNFNNGNLSQNKAVLNFPQPQSASSNLQSLDDDDWSDFISSPLPPATSNGYQQNWQNTSIYKQSNWANPSPNIITNPRHFVQSGSDMKNKVSNISVNSKKSTIPSISLPELEFIAPKERTSSSRKK
ncbi:uncharacterized protein LOC108916643 [Anoplophora glabripennis]|nr:uncharacterized protein LOC108916643 [Anoplophora glabripennis]